MMDGVLLLLVVRMLHVLLMLVMVRVLEVLEMLRVRVHLLGGWGLTSPCAGAIGRAAVGTSGCGVNASIWPWKIFSCSWVAFPEATILMSAFSSGSSAARIAKDWMTGSGRGGPGCCGCGSCWG